MENKTITVSRTSVTVLRMLMSLIFIVASLNHLLNVDKTISKMDQARFGFLGHLLGPPEISVMVSGVVMLVFGITFLVGFKPRLSAIVLIGVLTPITLTVQVGQMATIGPLFKNIAILGGLLFFVLNPKFKK